MYQFEVAKSLGTWHNCEKSVSEECGKRVHSYVFAGKERVVSLHCCVEPFEMGKDSHDAFLNASLEYPIYKSNLTKILGRNSNIWK